MDDLRERKHNVNLTEEQISEFRNAEALGSPERSKPVETRQQDVVSAPAKPMFIDAEGLQKTLQGLTNMALAHEIALNKDFQLKKPDRTTESMSQEVQEALATKEKYWEKVDNILMNNNIKECKHTIMDLIHTLKTMLHSTMLPHNVKMREKIDQELDLEKVSKQIDNDAFDFVHYMDFILDSLAALCCPIRDQEVVEIRSIEVPSKQVRRTIDLMENMNLDMANFIISQSRSHIVENCVTYERNKFASFVDIQYRMGNDPIKVTRSWILPHTIPERSFNETMAYAFLDILEWGDKDWPESLALDWIRFTPIREEIHRVIVIGAMVASVFDSARPLLIMDSPGEASNDFDKSQASMQRTFKFLSKLREELNLLITCEEIGDAKKFQEALERCCMQAVKVVEHHCSGMSAAQQQEINGKIRPLIDLNHPVRVLYYRRVKDWLVELAKDEGKMKIQLPQNISMIGPLIVAPITEMMRLLLYNRSVFDVLYKEIFDGNCPPPTFYPSPPTETSDTNTMETHQKMDESIVNLLAKLQGPTTDKSRMRNRSQPQSGDPFETLFSNISGSFEPTGGNSAK